MVVLTSIGFGDSVLGVSGQQVKQISSPSQLCYYKELIIDTKDVI